MSRVAEIITPDDETPIKPPQRVEAGDAPVIAQAVIRHLKGDLKGALQIVSTVENGLQTPLILAARGYLQTELGEFDAAAKTYAALTDAQPSDGEGWFQLAFCLYKLGRTSEALDRFERAERLGKTWIEIPLAKAICHLDLKQYVNALEQSDECLKREPDYMPALFAKAVTLHVTWEFQQATEIYRHIVEREPKHVNALMNLITLGLQQKQYDIVRKHADQLISIDSQNTLAMEGLGAVAFSAGDFDTACRYYSLLTEIAADQVEHWLNLGVTYQRKGMSGEAIRAFTRARQVRPESLYAHTYLGSTLWSVRDLGGARACYEQAVKRWPEREELTLSLSQILEELDLLEPAEQACKQFCERTDNREQVWFRLGYQQFRRGDFDSSADSFERALALKPAWPDAEIDLSLACLSAGRIDRAEQVLTGLIGREPENIEALKGLASVALARQDHTRALQLHLQLLEKGEATAGVYYNCGVLAQSLDQVEDAVRYYQEAIRLRQEFPEALLNLGHALKALGQEEQAKSFWIPALELNPELALNYFRRS